MSFTAYSNRLSNKFKLDAIHFIATEAFMKALPLSTEELSSVDKMKLFRYTRNILDTISNESYDAIIALVGSYDVASAVMQYCKEKSKTSLLYQLDPCSSNVDSGHRGIFYLTSSASGTVIEGFNFNNDDGRLTDSEDYAILINGASNVIIRNCTFSNNGVGDAISLEN